MMITGNSKKESPPKIIKLADLRDVIDKIDKGEITMSKGAEALNQIIYETLHTKR